MKSGVGFLLSPSFFLRESCLTFNSLSKRNCVHLKMLMSAEGEAARHGVHDDSFNAAGVRGKVSRIEVECC